MSTPSSDRVRVTISLSKELAVKIDEIIDGVKIRNRSHAIETLVTDSLDLVPVKQAVILAGGSEAISKIPAIKKIIGTLLQYGIFDITIAVGYLGEDIKREIGVGDDRGLRIHYTQSDLGTAGALLLMKSKIKGTFLVININQPVEINLKMLFKFHRDHQPLVTIATRSLRDLSGVYVMEPKVFSAIPPGFCMLEETIFDDLMRQGKLLSYPILTEIKEPIK